jgi:hypothetical protein
MRRRRLKIRLKAELKALHLTVNEFAELWPAQLVMATSKASIIDILF